MVLMIYDIRKYINNKFIKSKPLKKQISHLILSRLSIILFYDLYPSSLKNRCTTLKSSLNTLVKYPLWT